MDPASSSKDNMFGFDDPELSDKVLVLIEGEGDDQQTTKVHVTRLALCFRSEYFRNLFGQKFAEAKCDEVVLKLEDGETEPMMDLLKFIYSMMCNLSLQSDTLKEKSTMEVVQILMLADRYMFEDAIKACITIIDSRELSLDDCHKLSLLAGLRNHEALVKKISSKLDGLFETFEDNLDNPVCMKLPFELFRCMLSSDSVKLYSENSIWAGIVRWVEVNKPSEEKHVQLLECLRLDHMDIWYLVNFVVCSKYWLPSKALSTRLCLSLARTSVSPGIISELGPNSKPSRAFRNIGEIAMSIDITVDDDYNSPKLSKDPTWIAGIPFKFGILKPTLTTATISVVCDYARLGVTKIAFYVKWAIYFKGRKYFLTSFSKFSEKIPGWIAFTKDLAVGPTSQCLCLRDFIFGYYNMQ
eukprot:978389_1